MFVNFPNPKEVAQKLAGPQIQLDGAASGMAIVARVALSEFEIEMALRRSQAHTIMELANALDGVARQIEVRRTQVLPVDIYTTAQQLREWATKIESGEKP